jgi:hypothetical protein
MYGVLLAVAVLSLLGARWSAGGLAAGESQATPTSPSPGTGLLQGSHARRAKELDEQLDKAWSAGRFEEALRAVEAMLELRQGVQGQAHWQTADARWVAEAIRRILKQDAVTRREMARVSALAQQGRELLQRARYRELQGVCEKKLGWQTRLGNGAFPVDSACLSRASREAAARKPGVTSRVCHRRKKTLRATVHGAGDKDHHANRAAVYHGRGAIRRAEESR